MKKGILLVAVILLSTSGGCDTGITHLSEREKKLALAGKTKADRVEPAGALTKVEPTKVPVKTDGTRTIGSPIRLGNNLTTIKDVDHKLSLTLDFTYASSHIWRGFDLFPNNRCAFYTDADIDFWGTGFGMNLLWARPFGSGYEDWEWLVYSPYYYNAWWQDTPYQTDYRFGWRYFNFPDGSIPGLIQTTDEDTGDTIDNRYLSDSDFQEFYGYFEWPFFCDTGFVPYYESAIIGPIVGGEYEGGGSRSYWRNYGGWFHTFGVYKDWRVPGFLPCQPPEQVIRSSFEMVYNGGAGPTTSNSGSSTNHGWSHSVFGLSTEFYIRPNISFVPAVYFQSSWEDSVNKSDEYWATMSVRMTF